MPRGVKNCKVESHSRLGQAVKRRLPASHPGGYRGSPFQPRYRLETRGDLWRNPSYLGLLVTSLGFRSGIGVLLVAALLVPLVARIHAEERLLREHFGAEYYAYYGNLATRTSTPRISQGIAAQSQSPPARRPHLETAAEWVPPLAPVVLFEVVSFYPRVSPAGPPISGLRFNKSLYNRPPPSC